MPLRSPHFALVVVALFAAAPARAQDHVHVVHVAGDRTLATHLSAALSAITAALGPTADAAPLDTRGCDPEDEGCAARLVARAGTGATRLLVVRLTWSSTACVPMRDARGAVTGRRMLRAPTLELAVFDAHGTVLARESRMLSDDPPHVRAAALEALRAVGLAR